jgi:hypothetical protein
MSLNKGNIHEKASSYPFFPLMNFVDLTGNIEGAKRVALKLHCLIQLSFLNIPCMEFTDGAAADAYPQF